MRPVSRLMSASATFSRSWVFATTSARAEAEQAQRKLANESFLARAPAEVVAKTRDRLEAARADIDRLTGRLAALPRGDG